ncbi:hypothetical protein IFM89_034603 [Coptis chinensis]|uniref:Uncharacterized protein n=1 Tax=Coptis chinensis TaxID=261450 RepID=A0A835HPH0_9MAGN|nr:hypothetical protein IFM89_034603 [Coptis chinensis]
MNDTYGNLASPTFPEYWTCCRVFLISDIVYKGFVRLRDLSTWPLPSASQQEEKEMAHLYERRRFPYPGDTEATDAFIASGGAIVTTIGPKD